MDKNEKRACRRHKINQFLHCNFLLGSVFFSLSDIKKCVRILETGNFGEELKAYG
jgi:hypothetical protein